MSYSASDFVMESAGLLADKGYTFHSGDNHEAPSIGGYGWWFVWSGNGMSSYEVGDTVGSELEANMAALRHFFDNAEIPMESVNGDAR